MKPLEWTTRANKAVTTSDLDDDSALLLDPQSRVDSVTTVARWHSGVAADQDPAADSEFHHAVEHEQGETRPWAESIPDAGHTLSSDRWNDPSD